MIKKLSLFVLIITTLCTICGCTAQKEAEQKEPVQEEPVQEEMGVQITGAFMTLQDSYDKGLLSRDDIMEICYHAFGKVYEVPEGTEDFYDRSCWVQVDYTPVNGTIPELNAQIEEDIQNSYSAIYSYDYPEKIEVSYYGQYNNLYIVRLDSEDWSYEDGFSAVNFDGIVWQETSPAFSVFYYLKGGFMSLQDSYDKSLLSRDDIMEICYHAFGKVYEVPEGTKDFYDRSRWVQVDYTPVNGTIPELDAQIEEDIQNSYSAIYSYDYPEKIEVSYYGQYNNLYVVRLDSEDWSYGDGFSAVNFDGIVWYEPAPNFEVFYYFE